MVFICSSLMYSQTVVQHTVACTYMHACMFACLHACMHPSIQTSIHPYIRACIHKLHYITIQYIHMYSFRSSMTWDDWFQTVSLVGYIPRHHGLNRLNSSRLGQRFVVTCDACGASIIKKNGSQMLSVIAYEATHNYKLYPGSILQIGESQEL